jgi:DNA-binding protein H-NS
MAAADLKNMDVDALLALRADAGKMLADRSRDLRRQLALLGGGGGKKRARPAGGAGRGSALKGTKVASKYRGPDGERWAGRGAKPRWLVALLDEGHSIEEFAVEGAGGKTAPAAAKKLAQRSGGSLRVRRVGRKSP